MAFKFPFTNYHELNLTWVLDQMKKLFEESAENVTVIENYDGRLTAVETELPLVSDTAQDAAQTAAAAATLAQQAKSTADTAQENAIQAQAAAGQARQEAQAAQRDADAATQAAQQAQAIAQNFDGRITQAENDAAAALEASRSFENRVQAAITTANNAAQTATNAQGIATRADQNAALALDTLNAQRSELERIGAEQAALITEETESGKTEIENLAQSVLDSIPADYTAMSALVDKKAPVIINNASGSIASFDDGAEDMKIQKIVVNIEPLQAGSGDPSPSNVRPISGRTEAEIYNESEYDETATPKISVNWETEAGVIYGCVLTINLDRTGTLASTLTEVDMGSLNWSYQASNTCFYCDPAGKKSGICTAITPITKPAIATYTVPDYCLATTNATPHRIYTSFPEYTTVAAFKAAMSGVPLIYELEEPVVHHLTESEVSGILSTLYGTNNIWSNAGNVTVEYPADTKLYIDGKLAELQATILENI